MSATKYKNFVSYFSYGHKGDCVTTFNIMPL